MRVSTATCALTTTLTAWTALLMASDCKEAVKVSMSLAKVSAYERESTYHIWRDEEFVAGQRRHGT